MFSLIPREERFFDLFERSAANCRAVALAFQELVTNWDRVLERQKAIKDLEHEGDIITHEILDKLNRTFVTPFDREDIHNLTSELDDIVDLIDSTANRMVLYKVERPGPDLVKMAGILLEAVGAAQTAVGALRDMKRARRILDYCIEVNRLENEGDAVVQSALARLLNDATDPLSVIKWKEIYESVEDAIDMCEDVANTVEGIVVKNA